MKTSSNYLRKYDSATNVVELKEFQKYKVYCEGSVSIRRCTTQNLSAKLPNCCTCDLSISRPKLAEREKDHPLSQELAHTDRLSLIPLPLYIPREHRADTGVFKIPEENIIQSITFCQHSLLNFTITRPKISNLE